jgi:tetratricopeptide (TPR) repeat protein
MLVLVGSSSTGKTRACWEAVQQLAGQGWRLWHPFDPTRAKAALEDLHRVGPHTVVWLNEAQHYLGDRTAGEQIAAAVHHLLTSPECGPVLVLGTLWPEYAQRYTRVPAPDEADPHSRVRELLAGRIVHVPDAFDNRTLASARALADNGDQLLADALTRAHARGDGRVTQDLAGGPALLERYRTSSPAARALLEAAMDARRLGVGLHLPQAFLTDAAPDYLHDTDWNQLPDDWAEQAYAELAQQVHGKQAPLSRVTPRPQRRPPGPSTPAKMPPARTAGPVFRLADYLEQHGLLTRRALCPPASFWHAAHTHLTNPDELNSLADAAESRYRLQWAYHLGHRAADHGSTSALIHLALVREADREWDTAEGLLRQAIHRGDPRALVDLARVRLKAGDRDEAERLTWQAVDRGNPRALLDLVTQLKLTDDRDGAERLAREAADRGHPLAPLRLAEKRERERRWEELERLMRQPADHDHTYRPHLLAEERERAGDRDGAERLAREAADLGYASILPGIFKRLWLYGLDPDGTPTPPWRPYVSASE